MRAWQLPISGVRTNVCLHYFEVSSATNALVRAGCGRKFNPGFAQPSSELKQKRCNNCRRLARFDASKEGAS